MLLWAIYKGSFHGFCHCFVENGTIDCVAIGRRRYSSDLPQGGLEISCKLIFNGKRDDILQLLRPHDDKCNERLPASLSEFIYMIQIKFNMQI